MIAILLLATLLQDGPIRTAPDPLPQEDTAAVPAPACTFGRGSISAPGCPPARGRVFVNGPAITPPATVAAEEEANPGAALDRARLRTSATPGEGGGIPGWAILDPARWEVSQCGAEGDEACRRQARNRLAMARAGLATETPAMSESSGAAPNCRMVMQRAATGFGGSLSRVCGDGPDVEATLDRLEGAMRPVVESCDRPGSLESQAAWIARCRALTPR